MKNTRHSLCQQMFDSAENNLVRMCTNFSVVGSLDSRKRRVYTVSGGEEMKWPERRLIPPVLTDERTL